MLQEYIKENYPQYLEYEEGVMQQARELIEDLSISTERANRFAYQLLKKKEDLEEEVAYRTEKISDLRDKINEFYDENRKLEEKVKKLENQKDFLVDDNIELRKEKKGKRK